MWALPRSKATLTRQGRSRHRHGATVAAWVVAAMLSPISAAENDHDIPSPLDCDLAGQSDGVERGVNRTNLAWEKNWRGIIDQIAVQQISSIRLTLTQPIERAADIAAYADHSGLRVLLNVPLSLSDYYDPTVPSRPGNAKIRSIRRLSDLDVDRYEAVLRRFLLALDQRKARLDALEVGNEINWADFNGDLPVGAAGWVLDETSWPDAPEHGVILKGFQQYKRAVETSRDMLRASAAGKTALVISAGLYAPSAWTTVSGGAALSLPLTKDLFDRLGITQVVDGVAIHVYPPGGSQDEAGQALLLTSLRSALQVCGLRGAGKPCFVTEWGYPNSAAIAARDDHARLTLFRSFERGLSCLDRAQDIRAAYLFSWDESPSYSVWRHDRLLDAGRIFNDPPIP